MPESLAREAKTKASAWSIFWAEQGPEARCCARAPPDLLRKLDSHWATFAMQLPGSTSVLDLGCGGGIVGRLLVTAQPGLRVMGVDFADVPQPNDPRITSLSRTAMEKLPFARASFDAAVSQFGYEYAKNESSASELARVLKAGAPFSFLVHHAQSPLVKGMRSHHEAIARVCSAEFLSPFMSGNAKALEVQLSVLAASFPDDQIVPIVAGTLRRQVRQSHAQRLRVCNVISEALAPEAVMFATLEDHCVAPDRMHEWLDPLRRHFALEDPETLDLPDTQPIAWRLHGVRQATSR